MERMLIKILESINLFCQRVAIHPLTEYEMLLYEAMCNMMATYCKSIEKKLEETNAQQSEEQSSDQAQYVEGNNKDSSIR